MRLHDKVAIVTGAASGIGKGIALRYAEEGAHVVIADINAEGAGKTADEVKAKGCRALAVATDVSVRAQVQGMVDQAVREFGRIDILVNNAGTRTHKWLLEMAEEEWDRIIDTNLKGTFLCTQAAAREMVKRDYGRIINITSPAGERARTQRIHYVSSKGGINAFTRGAAAELAPHHITVNAIAPGITETELTQVYFRDPKRVEMYKKTLPLGRVGKPRDIANAALFLASDEAEWITGAILWVDGGSLGALPTYA